MATKKTTPARKLVVLAGNPQEIGANLQALIELNPEIEIVNKFVTQSIRPAAQSSILQPNQQQQYEPISVIYIIYTNPDDLVTSYPEQAPQQVKANLKPIIN